MAKAGTKPRIGRPPRGDDPQKVTLLIPGALRRWLRLQAAREMRDQGDILTDGLRLYRAHAPKRARRERP